MPKVARKSKVRLVLIRSSNLNYIQIPDSDSEPEPKKRQDSPPPKRPRTSHSAKASRPLPHHRAYIPQSKPPVESDSDHEPDLPCDAHSAKPSKKERKRKQSVQIKSREFIEDSDDENEGLQPVLSTPKPKAPKPRNSKKLKGAEQPDGDALRSESEISVLLDHSSPIKEREKAKQDKSKSESKSKDEEAIKRLKSFVVACGVRKIWSKEFKDLPTPSQQIAHLRNMLTELGMGSRPSLEQARAIKVRRELAQELEDVKEFDAAVNAPRKSRAAAPRHSLAESGGAADAQSDEGEQPSASPRRSAFGFLAGQSSDEE